MYWLYWFYWVLAIYLFFSLAVFYAMVNNILWFRSRKYILDFQNIETYELTKPRIRYYLIKHEVYDPEKWVVLLHPWGRNAARMTTQAKIYQSKGYSIVLVDAPGHGKSQWVPIVTGIDYSKYAYEICKKHGIEKPIVHGLSFGSISALIVSTRMEVKAVVPEAMFNNFKEMYDGFLGALGIPNALFGWIPWLTLKLGPDWSHYEPRSVLAHTDVPVFLIHGEKDEMFDYKIHFEANKEAAKNNTSLRSWLVPDSAHSKMSNHPEFEKKLIDFIQYVDKDN